MTDFRWAYIGSGSIAKNTAMNISKGNHKIVTVYSRTFQKAKDFAEKYGDRIIELKDGKVYRNGTIQAGDVYVDGSRVGDVGSVVIKDRKLMSNDGILLVILNINPFTKKLLTAIVIYMSFSLIMSIVWCLLQAPDLAITEAAVGAGVTSILFFVTLDKIKKMDEVFKENVKN